MAKPREFSVTIPKTFTYKEGWGVFVIPLYNEPATHDFDISDIEVEVVQIARSNVEVVGGAVCVVGQNGLGIPISTFLEVPDLWQDDTHDLRSRWFATELEARNHAASVKQTWDHPQPWQSFVRTL